MNRRTFLSTLAAAPVSAAVPKRPNILFILADDQRFDTINALGNTAVRTPNIDRIVRQGVSFTRAQIMGGTIGAVCAPSRGMLMTGQDLFRVHDSIVAPGKDPSRPPRPFVMFPELFRQHGYRTHGIGKWHNGPNLYARCFSSGENIFFGGMSNHLEVPVHDFDPTGAYLPKNRHKGEKFSSELFSDSAVKFLKGHDGRDPFCLYLAYTAPHDPRMAPKEWQDMYPPDKIELPRNFLPEHPFDNGELAVRDEMLAPHPRTPKVVREHIAAYYAMITHLDSQIGRVLDALEQTGRAKDTIIVFGGDNGLALGQHGLFGKQNMYEHSVRVPLIFSAPGMARNVCYDRPVYLHDSFPTLCDLAGIPIPETVESQSLSAVIRGHRSAKARNSICSAYRNFQRAVQQDYWKLIVYSVNGVLTKQLFDLRRDPGEMRNLAAESSQAYRIQQLSSELKRWMLHTGDPLSLEI